MKCFIVISDRHTGHKRGTVNPSSKMDEDVPVPLYPTAESLWEIVETAANYVNVNYKKADKYLIDLGEAIHGNLHTDDLLVSDRDVQIRLSKEALAPFLGMNKLKGVRFLQASSWHEMGNGTASKLLKEQVKFEHPKLDVQHANQTRMMIGDVLFEFTHHGSATSKRKYLEGNSAFLAAKDRIINHLIEGKKCPDLSFSAHTHKPSVAKASILSNGEYINNTQVITPPMCGVGAYSRKVANPDLYYVGMHVVITDGIGFEIIPFYKRLFDYTVEVV